VLFDVRTTRVGERTVVSVVGDVDLSSLPGLRSELDRAEGAVVVLDLASVDHFDPLGFGVVLAGALRVRRRGAEFVVRCSGRPRELFAEAGVDRIVDVEDAGG
jgi:anti-anti-sigma factor